MQQNDLRRTCNSENVHYSWN